LVSVVAFDPSKVGGSGAALKEVGSSFEEVGVFDPNPSDVFPGAKVVGESVYNVFGV
jgi:hypothetical protein